MPFMVLRVFEGLSLGRSVFAEFQMRNAIKTLKRLAFGFRNFSAFRARILLAVSPHPYI